jgi:hypothetical protein
MNEEFYRSVVQQPTNSHSAAIFEDRENILWIDWRDEEESIVSQVQERVGVADLTATLAESDNPWGYTVMISRGATSRTISPELGLDARHATLNALDELLAPEFQIRYVTETNGSDTFGVVVEKAADWQFLFAKYGRRVNEHFCPIRELPDLMNTPGNQLDRAFAAYADRTEQSG